MPRDACSMRPVLRWAETWTHPNVSGDITASPAASFCLDRRLVYAARHWKGGADRLGGLGTVRVLLGFCRHPDIQKVQPGLQLRDPGDPSQRSRVPGPCPDTAPSTAAHRATASPGRQASVTAGRAAGTRGSLAPGCSQKTLGQKSDREEAGGAPREQLCFPGRDAPAREARSRPDQIPEQKAFCQGSLAAPVGKAVQLKITGAG